MFERYSEAKANECKLFFDEYSSLTINSTPYSSIRYSNCSFIKPTTIQIFITPTSCNCFIILSIKGSPLTSISALGLCVLIGTILIPNPAANIIAF